MRNPRVRGFRFFYGKAVFGDFCKKNGGWLHSLVDCGSSPQ